MSLESNCVFLTAKGVRTCAAVAILSSQIGCAMQSAPTGSNPSAIPRSETSALPTLMQWEYIPFDFSIRSGADCLTPQIKHNCTCVDNVGLG